MVNGHASIFHLAGHGAAINMCLWFDVDDRPTAEPFSSWAEAVRMTLLSTLLQLPAHGHINRLYHSVKCSNYEIKFKYSALSHKLPIFLAL